MNKAIQHVHIKERFRQYNINGVKWGTAGKIAFIVGLSNFSDEEVATVPHYIVHGTTLLSFSLSFLKSSRSKFVERFYEKFMEGSRSSLVKNNTQAADIAMAFSDKASHMDLKEFGEIPEVIACVDRLRSQANDLVGDLKTEREERRVKELKDSFKSNVHAFIKRYHLSKDDVNSIIHECLREMEVEEVMKE